MTARNYYANVGIFTLVSIGVLVALIMVVASGSMFAAKVKCETYLVGSVNGLQVGSPVKFHGVPVGQVTGFGFPNITYGSPEEVFTRKPFDQWVTVYFRVESSYFDREEDLHRLVERGPSEGLRAQPALAGITGGAFIELKVVNQEDSPPPAFPWTPTNIYVPSAPSMVDKLMGSLEKVSENLARTDVAGTVARVDDFFANADSMLKQNRTDVRLLIQQMREIADNLEAVSQRAKSNLGGVLFSQPPPKLPPSNPGSGGK